MDEEDFIKAFEDVPAAQVGLQPRKRGSTRMTCTV